MSRFDLVLRFGVCICVHLWLCVCVYLCAYVCICVFVCVCVCVCVCVSRWLCVFDSVLFKDMLGCLQIGCIQSRHLYCSWVLLVYNCCTQQKMEENSPQWELCKENVLPLRGGRKVDELDAVLKESAICNVDQKVRYGRLFVYTLMLHIYTHIW